MHLDLSHLASMFFHFLFLLFFISTVNDNARFDGNLAAISSEWNNHKFSDLKDQTRLEKHRHTQSNQYLMVQYIQFSIWKIPFHVSTIEDILVLYPEVEVSPRKKNAVPFCRVQTDALTRSKMSSHYFFFLRDWFTQLSALRGRSMILLFK